MSDLISNRGLRGTERVSDLISNREDIILACN